MKILHNKTAVALNAQIIRLIQYIQYHLPLGPADELSDLGHEDVHGGHGLVVVVDLHVEGLDALGVVDHDRGALIHLHDDKWR